MILAYGSYRHALAEAGLTIERSTNFSPAGLATVRRERWHITGRLQAETVAALTTAIQALEAAYSVHNQDLILYLPDGVTRTAHQLLVTHTLGGVRVVRPPSYPDAQGAEYATFRSYAIEVEADILAPVTGAELLQWSEALMFSGGGQRWAYLPTLNGYPVFQVLQQATSFKVIQLGRAIGLTGYPTPAAPIWPTAWHQDLGGVTVRLPQHVGTADTQYQVEWAYHFESNDTLTGTPTARP